MKRKSKFPLVGGIEMDGGVDGTKDVDGINDTEGIPDGRADLKVDGMVDRRRDGTPVGDVEIDGVVEGTRDFDGTSETVGENDGEVPHTNAGKFSKPLQNRLESRQSHTSSNVRT
mmetsp:Transcript_42130/g.42711  ORF Transcript_42130/g.42711 Transcript_42130/m.42711 type:complete len:115 (-) Transcript_42130:440-784(-)